MTDARQLVQPLFMVYRTDTDEMVPLTQERLDQLIAAERQYGMMICDIRKSHEHFAARMGYTAKPFVQTK
jgi:hypothetical protein